MPLRLTKAPFIRRLHILAPCLLLALQACSKGGESPGAKLPLGGLTQPALSAMSDDAFAGAVHDLLLSEAKSGARRSRLNSVVAKQLERSAQKFRANENDRGMVATTGALYLIARGEFSPDMVTEEGRVALEAAVKDSALAGDEGRSQALYNLLKLSLADHGGKDLQEHLDALSQWAQDTYGPPGSATRAGAFERTAVRRRLYEPTQEAHDAAVAALREWIGEALKIKEAFRHHRQSATREDSAEAFRALQTGATALLSLYLMDGDTKGAIGGIDAANARELITPEAIQALTRLDAKPDAIGFVELLQAFQGRPERPDADDDSENLASEREFRQAVTFRLALQAYRLDPTLPEAAAVVAAGLQRYGMGEASPTVLLEAVTAHPEPVILSGALAIVMQAMALEVEEGSSAAARRVYRAADPLLRLADAPALQGKLQPSPPRVRALMGQIELGEGKIAEALALFNASNGGETSAAVLLWLARIEIHTGHVTEGLAHLRDAAKQAHHEKSHALQGEVLLTLSDTLQIQGDVSGAHEALTAAIAPLMAARKSGAPAERVAAERVLARVLDRFGEPVLAQHALERALVAAAHDKQQMTAVLTQQISRALVRGDLPVARDGLHRAVAADVDDDDITYMALWVKILERHLKAPTDGTPARVFASVTTTSRWQSKLAAFGEEKITIKDLLTAATSVIEHSEALFYDAMARRATGDVKGAKTELQQVLDGPGLELVEFGVARELVAPPRASLGPLPPGMTFP